jgi:uncharacterized protein YwgA
MTMGENMDQEGIILVCMAPASGTPFTPVMLQKLMFLVDKQVAKYVEGPHFHFIPHLYGPFDLEIYNALEQLEIEGEVIISSSPLSTRRTYQLSPSGQQKGDKLFKSIDPIAQEYITRASKWVQSLSFAQLVSAIYKAYPDMKENSVFRDMK